MTLEQWAIKFLDNPSLLTACVLFLVGLKRYVINGTIKRYLSLYEREIACREIHAGKMDCENCPLRGKNER